MSFLDHLFGRSTRHRQPSNGGVSERKEAVANAVAESIEAEARKKLEEAKSGGDERLREEARAMLELAEEVREGGEVALLYAMGAIGRGKD